MKIGVISDTHLKAPNKLLEKVAHEYFAHVDMILHAGDICTLQVLDIFKPKTVHAVAGNRDPKDIRKRLPEKLIVEAGGHKIGLIHGWGPPFGLDRRVRIKFQVVDCIVFGHSHRPCEKVDNGVVLFNPGSFASGLFSLWRRSIGILTIDNGIQTQVIKL